MEGNDGRRSNWAQLSDALLNLVLDLLKAHVSVQLPMYNLCKLPAVCTRFRTYFAQHRDTCDTLRLQNLKNDNLPSLLKWIHQRAPYVMQLWCTNGGQDDILLGALLSQQAPLLIIRLEVFPRTVFMISAFYTLITCILHHNKSAEPVDLEPLQSLKKLTELELKDGYFRNVNAAAVHLTQLRVSHCRAFCSQACACVTSLLQLHLYSTDLHEIHSMGVAAFHCLEVFDCNRSNVWAVDNDNDTSDLTFGGTEIQVPANLTALSHLTRLTFHMRSNALQESMGWVTCLTALQHLSAIVQCAEEVGMPSVVLPASLSCMTNLRTLFVKAESAPLFINRQTLLIQLKFDWKHLMLLERLILNGCLRVAEHCTLSSLASLPKLRSLKFLKCFCPDENFMKQTTALVFQLGCHRPDVQFGLDEV